MNKTVNERILDLREQMRSNNVDIYLVPTSDYHDSEYVGRYFACREFISGFTGSAGTVAVTADRAYLWTDGRYFLQAADELKGSEVILNKMGEEGVPTISEFLRAELKSGMTLGFDGRVFSAGFGRSFKRIADENNASVNYDLDLISNIWTDRPSISANKVFCLDDPYTGMPVSEKLAVIRGKMKENSCNLHIVTSLDDIAWILNLRGSDVECNPVFLSYLLLSETDGILFANKPALTPEALDRLTSNSISVKPYNDIYEYCRTLTVSDRVLIDPGKLNHKLNSIISDCAVAVEAQNPSTLLKACKNKTEQSELKKTNVKDGIAMVKFLAWLDRTVGKTDMTEISVSDKLESFRSEQDGYQGISFATIAGYNAHGAIIHYEPTPETDIPVDPMGLLLVDSGGQYLGGTTDITRTIAVGPLTEEMKHHYTMVLKANLRLSAVIFPEGVCGANLDVIARQPFWNEHVDYNHGTGHGVGYFLNVHEGPHNMNWHSTRPATLTPFREGMVVTDEPGIYIEGKYGIRIENDLLCVKDIKNEYGSFMRFDVLTLCPIDLRPVNVDELDASDKKILNDYHSEVREKLLPYLDGDDREWLINATRSI